ncbi:hypothetical protein PPOP_2001 [Paenibacillus popilliae ATCC 14706]|uniref:ADP ribosyltransferase domain-containing protein n=2 Tax=Paenibacillus popilliae TaxID=78057 RepID=M9M5M5_PAEPP|nr:hypothetical protein PPOP_2001 [Paenibacillus popilliae ATCC 14706]
MTLKKLSRISLIIAVTSCNLLATEIYFPSHLYAKGQTPAAELESLFTIGEEQLQAVKKEKQTELEEQQKKLNEEEKMLATKMKHAKELYEQIMKEIRENSNGYNVGKISDTILLSQILQGKRPKGRGSDKRVIEQIKAIREGQKQVKATKKRIAEMAAHYDQQITALEQKQAQHQAQQQSLQNNQQALLQVEKKAAQADGQAKQQRIELYQHTIQRITNAVNSMIQDLESSIAMISSELSTPANDHVKTMVSTLHAIANYKNIEQMTSKLETQLGHLPPEIIEERSTVLLQPLQAKQRNLHTQLNNIVTQLTAMDQKHAEPLLQFFQQSRLEELAVLENQLLATIKQQNAEKVTAIQEQLKRAEEREQAAYNKIGQSARERVKQQRLDGEVLLVDLWANWSEEGEEREAAQRRAEARTKQLIQVLKNPQGLSYRSLWQAIHPEQGTTMPSTQKTENNQAKQRLFTTVEQASHNASMAVDLGQQLKRIMDGIKGEQARKIANEPTFAKFFTELGNSLAESLQHPNQIPNAIWESNKQAVRAVEDSLQASLFGPGETETNAHIRQQVDKQQVLRTMVSLAQLIEQIDSEITISDLVAQAQLVAAMEQAAGTEEERAAYWSNLEAAAENVLQVKQAKANINGQRQALQPIFLPMVEMIEHNLFDSPGWQAQILDTLKYVQFILLAIDPIGSFVPISPEDATILSIKAASQGVGILSRTATKLEAIKNSAVEVEEIARKQIKNSAVEVEETAGKQIKNSAVEVEETAGKQIKNSAVEVEETARKQIGDEIVEDEIAVKEKEIRVCRPCGIGGRAKRSIVECCEVEPQPGTSKSMEQPELDDNIPAPPIEEEIAVMVGREEQPQPGPSKSTEQPEVDNTIPTVKPKDTEAIEQALNEIAETNDAPLPYDIEQAATKDQHNNRFTSILELDSRQSNKNAGQSQENKIVQFTGDREIEAKSWINKEAGKWENVATPEEYDALMIYNEGDDFVRRENGFRQIQGQLRKNKGNPGDNPNIRHINNIFEKMEPLSEDVIVYRGLDELIIPDLNNESLQRVLDKLHNDMSFRLHLTPEEYKSYLSQNKNMEAILAKRAEEVLKETGEDFRYSVEKHEAFEKNFRQFKDKFTGQAIKDYGYMSTSINPDISSSFGRSFFVELRLPKGAKAIAIPSDFENGLELEMLLPSGTEYIIKNVETITVNTNKIHQTNETNQTKKIKITADVKPPLKYVMKDQNGDSWLFKVNDKPGYFDWVGEAEVGTNKLLKTVGLPSIEVKNETIDIPDKGKLSGLLQKMVDLKIRGLGDIDVSKLTNENRVQLQQYQIIDYLIANLDCSADHFGVDYSNNIVALNKGKILKNTGNNPSLINSILNPDSILSLIEGDKYNTPYYPTMWNGWLKNKYEMDFMAVKPLIEKIERLSDTELSDMFKAYAEGREKQTGKSAKELLDNLVERKNTIRSKVEVFYKELAYEKGITFEGFSPSMQNTNVLKIEGLGQIDVSELTHENRVDLQVRQIVDYLTANPNCYADHFGIDHTNNIVTIDKALKPTGNHSETSNFTVSPDSILSLVKGNERNAPYYATMWNGWLKNKYEMDFMAVKPFIEEIERLSDTEFLSMVKSDVNERAKQTGKSVEELLHGFKERKNKIRSDVEAFYKKLAHEKGISFEGFSSAQTNDGFTFVGNADFLGGQSEKYIMKDQNEDSWLFKVNGKPGKFDWVGEAEVGANKLLHALGQPSVEIENTTFDIPDKGKLSGSLQKMIDLKTWGLDQIDVSKLSNENRVQLQQHQIIDYLIANLDCHSDNFGIDYRNHIVAFDKGQALKHIGDHSEITNFTLNPDSILSLVEENEYNAPYYPTMWKGWLGNQYEMDFMAVKPLIEKIERLSDTEFSDMFKAYAEGREKQTGKSAKELLDNLVERKNTIRSKVEAFYKELARKKGITFDGFSSDAMKESINKLAS